MSKQTKADKLSEKGDSTGLTQLMYHGTDWLGRLEAAEALALMGQDNGVDYLLECLQDPEPDVRAVAIEILQSLDNPRATQELKEMSMDGVYALIQEDPNTLLECGNCGAQIPARAKVCPQCGIQLYGDRMRITASDRQQKGVAAMASQAQQTLGKRQSAPRVQQVAVVDFDMPFASLVGLLVKALAAIPALLILVVIAGFLAVVFGGMLVSIINQP